MGGNDDPQRGKALPRPRLGPYYTASSSRGLPLPQPGLGGVDSAEKRAEKSWRGTIRERNEIGKRAVRVRTREGIDRLPGRRAGR